MSNQPTLKTSFITTPVAIILLTVILISGLLIEANLIVATCIAVFQFFLGFFIMALLSVILANTNQWGKSTTSKKRKYITFIGFILFICSLTIIILKFFLNTMNHTTNTIATYIKKLINPMILKFEDLIRFIFGTGLSYQNTDSVPVNQITNDQYTTISQGITYSNDNSINQILIYAFISIVIIMLIIILVKTIQMLSNNAIQKFYIGFKNWISTKLVRINTLRKSLYLLISSKLQLFNQQTYEYHSFKKIVFLGALFNIDYSPFETPREYGNRLSQHLNDYSTDINQIISAYYLRQYSTKNHAIQYELGKKSMKNLFSFKLFFYILFGSKQEKV